MPVDYEKFGWKEYEKRTNATGMFYCPECQKGFQFKAECKKCRKSHIEIIKPKERIKTIKKLSNNMWSNSYKGWLCDECSSIQPCLRKDNFSSKTLERFQKIAY